MVVAAGPTHPVPSVPWPFAVSPCVRWRKCAVVGPIVPSPAPLLLIHPSPLSFPPSFSVLCRSPLFASSLALPHCLPAHCQQKKGPSLPPLAALRAWRGRSAAAVPLSSRLSSPVFPFVRYPSSPAAALSAPRGWMDARAYITQQHTHYPSLSRSVFPNKTHYAAAARPAWVGKRAPSPLALVLSPHPPSTPCLMKPPRVWPPRLLSSLSPFPFGPSF